MTINLLASVAQHERKVISERTKAALVAAKRRGVTLGNPNGAKAMHGLRKDHAVIVLKGKADKHAKDVLPVIENSSFRRCYIQSDRNRIEQAGDSYGPTR